MTQRKIDDLFAPASSSVRSGKRPRGTQATSKDRDDFDDLFETGSSSKRRRTNVKPATDDVFDFEMPTAKKPERSTPASSLTKKRSAGDDNAIDDLFSSDARRKVRRPIKQEESSDPLEMFKPRTNTHVASTEFKTPMAPKSFTTQKKVKMFFDDADLVSLREQTNEQDETKEYAHVKPVVINGGRWLSKEVEAKVQPTEEPMDDCIPEDQRNLMHIQYAPLVLDDEPVRTAKQSSRPKRSSLTSIVLDGKSFQKQLVLSESNIVRKENLQSCYNTLLEDINKPRLAPASSSSSKSKVTSSSRSTRHSDDDDDDPAAHIDFFDLPTRKKKF